MRDVEPTSWFIIRRTDVALHRPDVIPLLGRWANDVGTTSYRHQFSLMCSGARRIDVGPTSWCLLSLVLDDIIYLSICGYYFVTLAVNAALYVVSTYFQSRVIIFLSINECDYNDKQNFQLAIVLTIKHWLILARWLYCVECPQYSIRLEGLGYLCTSCLLPAFDEE